MNTLLHSMLLQLEFMNEDADAFGINSFVEAVMRQDLIDFEAKLRDYLVKVGTIEG